VAQYILKQDVLCYPNNDIMKINTPKGVYIIVVCN
jgi:hypothetical protein